MGGGDAVFLEDQLRWSGVLWIWEACKVGWSVDGIWIWEQAVMGVVSVVCRAASFSSFSLPRAWYGMVGA